jgi:hypothetical protein
MCRWENGGCSFVLASTKDLAIQYLDEIGNADGSELTAMRDFMVHFELTPEGKLQLHSFGELAADAIFEKAYPVLNELFQSDKLSDQADPTVHDAELIKATVEKECQRLQGKKRRKLPQTEIGRRVAAEMDVPASMMDGTVDRITREKLKKFRSSGKPH